MIRQFVYLTAALMLGATWAAEAAAPAPETVLAHYGDMAQAMYGDVLAAAKALQRDVDTFLADPTPQKLMAAREAWKRARVPYSQSEAFRFGNPVVDAWEPRVNSWPLDEGLIDYVASLYGTTSDENPLYTLNVIAHPRIRVGAKVIDASHIDKKLLRELEEAQGVKTNVAIGYHAIEFLLWGQDLHGTNAGAGERPATDYDLKHCTHGNCDRRAAYLRAVTGLLVDDLAEMVADWGAHGKARATAAKGGLATMLIGIGSLSYGELAGERMKLGLILHDPEEEQDCFSDNTHSSHYYNQLGMIEIWRGSYGGKAHPSLRDYAMAKDAAAAKRLDAAMEAALTKIKLIKGTADSGRMSYDQMIGNSNLAGNTMVQNAVDALVAQTRATEGVMQALGLKVALQGSEKFDSPTPK